MSIKKQRIHLATFFRFRYASLLANMLRDVNERRLKFPILGQKVRKNDLAKICVELSGFLLKDASCDQRMLQNMAKSPNSFIATLKLLRS